MMIMMMMIMMMMMVMVSTGCSRSQSIDQPPENTAALIDTTSHLNCTVTLSGDHIQWIHYLEDSDTGQTA